MEKRIFKVLAGCAILGVLMFTSCRKLDKLDNLKVVNYDAEFAIPLFKAKASFDDILEGFDEDTKILIGPDGLITVYYKGDVAGRTSTDFFATLIPFFGLPIPIPDTIYPLPFNVPNSVDIDYAILKSGTFDFGFIDTLDADGTTELTVTLPNIVLDGEPFKFTKTYTTTFDDGNDFISIGSGPFDMTGYKIIPTDDTIKIHYHAHRLDYNQTPYFDTLSIFAVTIDDFQTSYVEGYLGSDIYELEPDTIVIDFFENWTRGDVYFADPKINLYINNSFGFPVRSKVNVLNVFNVDGGVDTLESDYLNDINVDFPSFSEVGETKTTFFDFNKDNSNIDVILGNGPVAIDYDFDVVANPDSVTSNAGFMTDSSYMNVLVEVELPMYGAASGFEARDTFSINFEEYQDFDEVEFKVISENGIPLDVGVQIFFADQNGTLLDSLFTPSAKILEAAPVDGEGLPTAITEKITFTTFTGERFEKIKTAKKAFLRTSFSTINNGGTFVKILSTQEVEIRMGMKIGVSE